MGTQSVDFDTALFHLVHDEIKVDKLLGVLKIRFNDNLQSNHRNIFSILNKGTKIVSKYIFLVEHYRYYLQNTYGSDLEFEHDIFHIIDQHDEAKLELIDSILLARAGMISQAINTLRRAFEAAIYGTFFATSSLQIGNNTVNPFIRLVDKGLWSSSAGNRAIRYSQIKPIVRDIKSSNKVSQNVAEFRVLTAFTENYLEYLCQPVCEDHYNKKKHIVSSFPSRLKKKCYKCNRKDADRALVENPITMGLMIAVTDARLRKTTDKYINLNRIYSHLSSYLHPNPESHQHEPIHQLVPLQEWLDFITRTVNTLTWLYMRCTQKIGYQEKAIHRLLSSKNYNMNKVTLSQMKKILCQYIADHEKA